MGSGACPLGLGSRGSSGLGSPGGFQDEETEAFSVGHVPTFLPSWGKWDLPPGPGTLLAAPGLSFLIRSIAPVGAAGRVQLRAPRHPDPLYSPQVAVSRLPRQHWEALGAPEAPHEQPWPLPVVVQLGKQLAEVLVQTVRMPSHLAERQGSCKLIPVLYHVYSFRSFRQVGRWNLLPA